MVAPGRLRLRHVESIGREGARARRSLMGEIERLEKQIAALQESLLPPAELPLEPPTEQEMRWHLEVIADALREGNPEKRREVYQSLIRRIVISPKSTRIEGTPSGGLSMETVNAAARPPI